VYDWESRRTVRVVRDKRGGGPKRSHCGCCRRDHGAPPTLREDRLPSALAQRHSHIKCRLYLDTRDLRFLSPPSAQLVVRMCNSLNLLRAYRGGRIDHQVDGLGRLGERQITSRKLLRPGQDHGNAIKARAMPPCGGVP